MHSFFMFFFAIILLSCGSNTYENYHSFNHNGWNADSIVSFNYTITNPTKKYELRLKIRHTIDYEFQNLFLFLEEYKKDTIEIILANKSGEWLGFGVSDVREFEFTLDKERIFPKKGNYKIKLEQAMRYGALSKIVNLEHVLDVGLIVSEHND